jgi:ribosome-associated protein
METKKFVEVASPVIPEAAYEIEAVRSSGPGGQNVNKVSSKIRLRLDLARLVTFSERQKQLLREAAGHRWSEKQDVIIMECEQTRDQPQNRRLVMENLAELAMEALKPRKKRRPTRPTYASKQRRVNDKVRRGQQKQSRRSGGQDGW